jgi:hypothetical protein
MEFYYTGLNPDITADELDKIAVEQRGLVMSIGYGHACRGELPDELHGYRPRWIDRRGMGNHGSLVLTAVSEHAREMLRRGWVRYFELAYGLDHATAVRMTEATAVHRGREAAVIECVLLQISSRYVLECWKRFPGCGGGVYHWATHYGIDTGGCSAPRLDAVHSVLRKGGWIP